MPVLEDARDRGGDQFRGALARQGRQANRYRAGYPMRICSGGSSHAYNSRHDRLTALTGLSGHAHIVAPIGLREREGGLLNKEQILKRLERGGIFLRPTWNSDYLRSTGYDLRLDSRLRALNDEIFEGGREYGENLQLAPGDSACVVSYERFVMPWDLAANLGTKFRCARLGLSVVTGLLVDPGYGQRADGAQSEEGFPLHFFVINIGSGDIAIRLGQDGDEVLSIQFLKTAELAEKKFVSPPKDVTPGSAVGVFKGMRELDRKVSKINTEIEGLRSATEYIVVFGVFLLAVSLIGVSATILFEALGSTHLSEIIDSLNRIHLQGTSATVVTVAGLAVLMVCVLAAILALTKGFAWALRRGTGG